MHRTGTSQRPASQICSFIKAFLVAHGTSKLYCMVTTLFDSKLLVRYLYLGRVFKCTDWNDWDVADLRTSCLLLAEPPSIPFLNRSHQPVQRKSFRGKKGPIFFARQSWLRVFFSSISSGCHGICVETC